MKKLFLLLNLILLASISFSQINLSDSLKLYYPFNGIYDIYVPDESGNANRGLASNVWPAYDRFDQRDKALYFSGNSYISFEADQFKLDEYTYSAWVKINDQPDYGTADFIIDIGSEYGVDQFIAYTNDYSNYQIDGFHVMCYNKDGSASWLSQYGFIETDEWKFVVFTRDSSLIKLYIDAVVIDSVEVQGLSPNYGEEVKGYVGCRNNLNQHFTGYLDDIRIYSYAISQTIIEELFLDDTLGIVSNMHEQNMLVYPNPTKNNIQLQLPDRFQNYQVNIYNSMGSMESVYFNLKEIDVAELARGLYFIRVVDNKSKLGLKAMFIKN